MYMIVGVGTPAIAALQRAREDYRDRSPAKGPVICLRRELKHAQWDACTLWYSPCGGP